MAGTRAVVWLDHQQALLLHLGAEAVQPARVHAHPHATPQHGSGVRTEHEYFAAVCAALAGIDEVLVTGAHTALADLRHFVGKHAPGVAPRLVGFQVVDHPTEHQLAALGRQFFRQRAAGLASAT